MNVPNTITFLRVLLSPLFFLVYFLPQWFSLPAWPMVLLLCFIFAVIEFSDLFDGIAARKLNQVTELGKILDPFGDSVSRLTYFLCYSATGLMPVWAFALVLYRDLCVAFIRLLQAREGISMPARLSGKIKAWVYLVTGIAGVLTYSAQLVAGKAAIPEIIYTILMALFIITALTAVWTLWDYTSVLRNKPVQE